MSDVLLGELAPANADRDATHVAVVPMIAAERMRPGTHCGIVEPGKAGPKVKPLIGIVDPFLNSAVKAGELFYLCLYPRSITGLRHVYTHPVLDAEGAAAATQRKARSEEWLRQFCNNNNCPDYETVLNEAIAIQSIMDKSDYWRFDYLHFQDMDAHGEIPPEFWDHVEVVIGQPMKRRASYFSCSC